MGTTTPEGKVKHAIKKLLDELEVYYHMPVQNGMGKPTLDFVCCVGGAFVGIEAKSPGLLPTPKQLHTMTEMRAAGGHTFWLNDVTEIGYLRAALLMVKEMALVMKALEE
jgi:hypothetical protein